MATVDGVLDNLITNLEGLKDTAEGMTPRSSKRVQQAILATRNNLDEAKEIKMLNNSKAKLDKLNDRYKHTKHWEHQFNVVWGGDDNMYAGFCHGKAKDWYRDAIMECKNLSHQITKSFGKMVLQVAHTKGRPGQNSYEQEVKIKTGYTRDTKVESELHTKIAATVEGSMNQLVSSFSATLSAEASATLKSSTAIQNTRQTEESKKITLDLSTPVYVYQVQYSSVLADGSCFDCWGPGIIISPSPLA